MPEAAGIPDFNSRVVEHARKDFPLLDAESRISGQMAKNPDDAGWLRLRARAEMLDRNYDDAVSTLNRAADAQPDDKSLLADLGMAYALRAEGDSRDVDYGYAIEYVSRSLKAKPNSPAAVFNRAVVYENKGRIADAVADYKMSLQKAMPKLTALKRKQAELKVRTIA